MNIAIVEDDINMRKSLEFALSEYKEFSLTTYKSAIDALKKIDSSVDLIVTDINMPGMDGIEFIKELDGRYDIIVITGNATLNRAIESVRLGVKDFLTKPFEVDTLVDAIKRQVIISKKVKSSKKDDSKSDNSDFVASSDALDKALKLSKKAARTDASVLLMGESGVGKELFANFVHKNSPRAKGKFIAINMAAIPENLLESELFGYEKGAFTDATTSKKGHFEIAHGGTLFLDEIAEMPISLQAKLLRVLQERVITRVGGTKEIEIDVRIVSATNADIHKAIEKNEFREDLYYRLNTIPVKIPSLRERKEEIEPIANYTLKEVCKKYELDELEFSKEALKELNSYSWPGNIRELISVVERAAILSDNNVISLEDLFLDSRNTNKTKSIDSMEKELIQEVLQSVQDDKLEAAKILGMSKVVLDKKINKYNIEVAL
ncbi:sigma-54-dependent transcriptional regulator [Sulfurospirillum arcachonense]|uniref:sigma-54-dependent transcriptional regulator n=1 Tax=Sulfurospirillum arcachonense TaxID=57666 RepID=UPI00046A087E|nr:sigma-54 dependent transcriptional regulator [Sulfurospirillum arcachonense]